MSSAVRDFLEKVSELEWAVKQSMKLPDDFNMGEAWHEYQEMCSDPTWLTDRTSAPPNFHDWLLDCK